MNDNEILNEATQQNAVVLAAVGGLVADILRDVSGNEISNSLEGQSLTQESAQILVNQELTNHFIRA